MSESTSEDKSEKRRNDSKPPIVGSVEDLLFNTPLYATCGVTRKHVEILYGRATDVFGHRTDSKIDGYCPFCKREATFEINAISIPSGDPWDNIEYRHAFDNMSITCVRSDTHRIKYYFLVRQMTITKVGQHPSLADIAIDETRQKYRAVLKGENWGELYKAIGLAAHGEGIGSFVYLRRVFENLINSRFNEFRVTERWDEVSFKQMRMEEKIELLKDHLPRSLVETRKIYKIFSLGIHELKNDACLQFFEVGKRSIIMVLDDDLKKQQDLADRKQLMEAVAKFGMDTTPGDPDAAVPESPGASSEQP
jgi:hypothetical protein